MSDYGSQLPPPNDPPSGWPPQQQPPQGWPPQPPPQGQGWPPQQPPGWPPQGQGPQGYQPYPNPEEMGGPAWEHRDQLGILSAYFRTFREVLGNPVGTFVWARRRGGIGNPLSFTMITAAIVGMITHFTAVLTGQYDKMAADLDQVRETFPPDFMAFYEQIAQLYASPSFKFIFGPLLFLTLAPLMAVLFAFINAGVAHLCMMIFGGANRDYECTLRAYCYANSSAKALQAIPLCGPLVALPVGWVMTIIALKEMHQTDTWRAAFSVLLPVAVCCCMIASPILLIAFSAAAAATQ